jgi:hypothetical protein
MEAPSVYFVPTSIKTNHQVATMRWLQAQTHPN